MEQHTHFHNVTVVDLRNVNTQLVQRRVASKVSVITVDSSFNDAIDGHTALVQLLETAQGHTKSAHVIGEPDKENVDWVMVGLETGLSTHYFNTGVVTHLAQELEKEQAK